MDMFDEMKELTEGEVEFTRGRRRGTSPPSMQSNMHLPVNSAFHHTSNRGMGSGSGTTVDAIMEALSDANIYNIGVCGKDGEIMASMLEIVKRRVTRDSLFGVTVMLTIDKNPNLSTIQQEIADELGLCFQGQGKGSHTGSKRMNNVVQVENAMQLHDRIMKEPKILFILRGLKERLELGKLGIPIGSAHQGCKLILTSESEEVLSKHMNTQRTIKF